MNVLDQQRFVADSVGVLPLDRLYAFSLLICERLLSAAEAVHPSGLPTRRTPYAGLSAELDVLWHRSESDPPRLALAKRARRRRPVVPSGHVEHVEGAAIGFYVSESIARLATVSLAERADLADLAGWMFESVASLLLSAPDRPDYSIPFVQMELTPELNAPLLREFEAESSDHSALAASPPADWVMLRREARSVGAMIGRLASPSLMRK